MRREHIGLWGIDDPQVRKKLERRIRDQVIIRSWYWVTAPLWIGPLVFVLRWAAPRLGLPTRAAGLIVGAAAGVLGGMIFYVLFVRKRERVKTEILGPLGRCVECGFDLDASPSRRQCPECGRAAQPANFLRK